MSTRSSPRDFSAFTSRVAPVAPTPVHLYTSGSSTPRGPLRTEKTAWYYIDPMSIFRGIASEQISERQAATSGDVDRSEKSAPLLGESFAESELVIGLVGAVGTDLKTVGEKLRELLQLAGYTVQTVHISRDIIPVIVALDSADKGHYERVKQLMDAGNDARLKTGDNAILALGAASWIASKRPKDTIGTPGVHRPRHAYIVHSLKHPAEVQCLREIYPQGFYLLGVHCDKERRGKYLEDWRGVTKEEAERLIERDKDERSLPHGQHVSDTFHLSDFFVRIDGNDDRFTASLRRIIELLLGHPNITPTFDEYAMFLAFAASLRSADLSRQVGAVVARDNEILATGANDCPRFGGGLYWPELDPGTGKIDDEPEGRDYKRGEDSNAVEKQAIIDRIIADAEEQGIDASILRPVLEASAIRDITEYGRVVHAEMEALLSCARNHASTRKATIYCTTFPCHNCAKHIIAAGIERVVYVEPYEKSKASEFHTDALQTGFSDGAGDTSKVYFEPFVGIGPRRFFDLFSMRLGSGDPIARKSREGKALQWTLENAKLRLQMLPATYLDLEYLASNMFRDKTENPDG